MVSGTVRSSTLERRVFSVYFFSESRKDETLLNRMRGNLLRVLGQEILDTKTKQYEAMRDVLLLEAETLYGEGVLGQKEEEELIRHLEEDHITKLLSSAMDALARAEREGGKEDAQKLLEKCKELTQKLAALKSARFLP